MMLARGRDCCRALALPVAGLAAVWPAGVDGQTAGALRFAETGPIVLTDEAAVLHLFNDDTAAVEGLEIRATLGIDLLVPVEVDPGSGFIGLADSLELSIEPGGGLRLGLRRPEGATPATPGRVLVRGTVGEGTMVARLALTAGGPSAASAVNAWSVVSTQGWLWPTGGGDVGRPIPLTPGSTCGGTGRPEVVLTNGDRTARLTVSCDSTELQLVAPEHPPPGSYTGQITVGGAPVPLRLRRTMSWWWPVLAIGVGLLVALWSQGQLDRSWNVAQWSWLKRLKGRAEDADTTFQAQSKGEPWAKYQITPGISDKADELQEKRKRISRGVKRAFRILPWPEGFKAHERKDVRDGILELDRLVRTWPTMPDAFSGAHGAVTKAQMPLVTWARGLKERAEELLVPQDPLTPTSQELASCIAQVGALPGAIQVVERLAELHGYLDRVERETHAGANWFDRGVFQRARQAEREAAHLLAAEDTVGGLGGLSDATEVLARVGPIVERGRTLARRLPRPLADSMRPMGEEVATAAARKKERQLLLSLGRSISGIAKALRPHRFHLTGAAAIFVTLLVTLWGGLAALYLGKAWGSWLDFAAAGAWGFGAASVLAPVVSWLQQLGARPQDVDPGEA